MIPRKRFISSLVWSLVGFAVPVQAQTPQLKNALQRHTGLQKSALAVDMSRTREKLERAELLPHVALLAEDHLDGPITTEVPPINKNINYWFVGVGVTYNFSSLYKNNRKLRQARLATAVAQDRRSVALEEVGDAVHAAYVELGTARTALATRQKSVQLALENYDVVSKRYANGLALITDLTDAAAMKLDASQPHSLTASSTVFCTSSARTSTPPRWRRTRERPPRGSRRGCRKYGAARWRRRPVSGHKAGRTPDCCVPRM